MRSMVHDALKDMKESGGRLREIEHIRCRLRKENASKQAFLQLDRWHRTELDFLKGCHRHLVIGAAFAFLLIVLGIISATIAMISFKSESMVVGLIMTTCSVSALYLGKKQIFG